MPYHHITRAVIKPLALRQAIADYGHGSQIYKPIAPNVHKVGSRLYTTEQINYYLEDPDAPPLPHWEHPEDPNITPSHIRYNRLPPPDAKTLAKKAKQKRDLERKLHHKLQIAERERAVYAERQARRREQYKKKKAEQSGVV